MTEPAMKETETRDRGSRPALNPVVRLIATGGFLGYAPIAPGTVGAFGCAVLMWFLAPEVTPASGGVLLGAYLVSVAAFLVLSVWASDVAERSFGKDASRIVVDEYAGFVVSVLLLPKSVFVYAAAFLLFRVFDIVKPFPARRAESAPGGIGVVLDDVVAGVYANILVRIMMMATGW